LCKRICRRLIQLIPKLLKEMNNTLLCTSVCLFCSIDYNIFLIIYMDVIVFLKVTKKACLHGNLPYEKIQMVTISL
jgi:hypothetical protein